MKKVLIVGMTEGIGGVEAFICNVKKYISLDIKIDFLVHQDINKKYEKEIYTNGSKVFKVTGIKSNVFKYLKEIFSFYKNNQYDVVHLHECDAKMFLYCLPLLFNKKPRLIVHSHSTSAKNAMIHKIICFFQNRRANIKWACSKKSYEYMFGSTEKPTIIHNGIDLDSFKFSLKKRVDKRAELNIQNDTVFCSVARFTKEKNHEKIIDIFFEFNKMVNNSKLLLIGTGPLQNDIREKVKRLGIEDKVLFLNARSDIPEILSASDVFLLPSLYEGIPFVSLEGQASGLKFFASDKVSKEIVFTDLITFINLDASSVEWATIIKNSIKNKIDREDAKYIRILRNEGFDLKKVSKIIEKEYRK